MCSVFLCYHKKTLPASISLSSAMRESCDSLTCVLQPNVKVLNTIQISISCLAAQSFLSSKAREKSFCADRPCGEPTNLYEVETNVKSCLVSAVRSHKSCSGHKRHTTSSSVFNPFLLTSSPVGDSSELINLREHDNSVKRRLMHILWIR